MKIFAEIFLAICVLSQFAISAEFDEIGGNMIDIIGDKLCPKDKANFGATCKLGRENLKLTPKELLIGIADRMYEVRGDVYHFMKNELVRVNAPSASANDFKLFSSSKAVNKQHARSTIENILYMKKELLEQSELYEKYPDLERRCHDSDASAPMVAVMYGNFGKYSNAEVAACLNSVSKIIAEKCIREDYMRERCSLYSFVCGAQYDVEALHSDHRRDVPAEIDADHESISATVGEMSRKNILVKAVYDMRENEFYDEDVVITHLRDLQIPGESVDDLELLSSEETVDGKHASWAINTASQLKKELLEKAKRLRIREWSRITKDKYESPGAMEMYGNFRDHGEEEVIACLNNASRRIGEECVRKDGMKRECGLYSFMCGLHYDAASWEVFDYKSSSAEIDVDAPPKSGWTISKKEIMYDSFSLAYLVRRWNDPVKEAISRDVDRICNIILPHIVLSQENRERIKIDSALLRIMADSKARTVSYENIMSVVSNLSRKLALRKIPFFSKILPHVQSISRILISQKRS